MGILKPILAWMVVNQIGHYVIGRKPILFSHRSHHGNFETHSCLDECQSNHTMLLVDSAFLTLISLWVGIRILKKHHVVCTDDPV